MDGECESLVSAFEVKKVSGLIFVPFQNVAPFYKRSTGQSNSVVIQTKRSYAYANNSQLSPWHT